ncbi:MAG: dTDP-4-dehydrorhamnose reductase [Oscillospiraceae bacterium]|nr:dTDP-4-dehydrorhamnose reductase [Oscillospiraceae bacterium]
MRVLLTGYSGQLGHDAAAELTRRQIPFLGVTSREMDLTREAQVEAALADYRPDAVLHCAAYTAVDRAEEEPERCMAVNGDGTRHLARGCAALGAKLLYVSTDYVFSGEGTAPYEVTDPTGPLNVYGRSKLAGEEWVRQLVARYFIVRTSWLMGRGNNFVKTMLRMAESRRELRVVDDQIGSPTFTADLAPLLVELLQSDRYGVYHAANEGFCSWAELAEETFRLAGRDAAVRRVTTEEYGARALRPKNSRLSQASLARAGFGPLPPWQESLKVFLRDLGQGGGL